MASSTSLGAPKQPRHTQTPVRIGPLTTSMDTTRLPNCSSPMTTLREKLIKIEVKVIRHSNSGNGVGMLPRGMGGMANSGRASPSRSSSRWPKWPCPESCSRRSWSTASQQAGCLMVIQRWREWFREDKRGEGASMRRQATVEPPLRRAEHRVREAP